MSDDQEADVVLVRVYGEATDLIIDRGIEILVMRVLNATGFCRPLFCKFNNGIGYGFTPGICLDEQLVRDSKIARLIAKEMVSLHSVNVPDVLAQISEGQNVTFDTKPFLFKKCFQFLSNVPDHFPNPEKNARYKKYVRSKSELENELMEMQHTLEAMNCPVVFCHNDILLKNIVYNAEKERAFFIDFEYGAYNYLPFELGNHFCEYAGLETTDFSLYPDKEYQLKWLRTYLEFKFEAEGKTCDVTDNNVETLYVQVNKFALMAHFFWGLWALVQARISLIDFDYLDYARIRFDEYFARKTQFLSLEIPQV